MGRRTELILVTSVVYAILRAIVIHLDVFGHGFSNVYGSYEFFIIGFIAMFMIFYARTVFDKGTLNYKTTTYLGFGFIFWAMGNAVWAFYVVFLEKNPNFSIADIFYIAGFIPVIYILIYRSRSTPVSPEKKRLIAVTIIFIVFVFSGLTFVIFPILRSGRETTETVILIVYPILDIILMGSALSIFPKYAGGKLERIWFLASICAMLNATADLLFAYQDWQKTYSPHSWVDDIYIYTYLVIIIFAVYLRDLFRKVS